MFGFPSKVRIRYAKNWCRCVRDFMQNRYTLWECVPSFVIEHSVCTNQNLLCRSVRKYSDMNVSNSILLHQHIDALSSMLLNFRNQSSAHIYEGSLLFSHRLTANNLLTFKKRGNLSNGCVPSLIWSKSNGTKAAKSKRNFRDRM